MTLPNYDEVTEYLDYFSQEIIEVSKNVRIPITVLAREKASRSNFELELKDNCRLVVFNGHGSQNIIEGQKGEAVIINGENENLLKEKITYSRSCYSADGIGRKSMEGSINGCFIGYTLPFVFYNDTTWTNNPSKDNTAKVFFASTNLIPIEILNGKTCHEADIKSKKAMLKAIKRNLIKGNKDSQSIAEALWNNYSVQTVIGNDKTKFNI